ncbi:MAG: phenylalanine--tRNA ligase subunit beta [Ilumatobacteraceae bacterium]
MKVSLSWLNEFADFGDDVDRISSGLTSLGLAVDGVERHCERVDGVVVAKVLRTEKHADAAKVTRVWVDAGDGAERHIWCGATNMKAGDLVPLATIGTKMPDGREISRRGILGIDSEGMLCSGVELGIDEDSAGLKILPGDCSLGQNVFDALGLSVEVVFDLDVTRNRPDCYGHLGVARDLAAKWGLPLRSAGPSRKEGKTLHGLTIDVRDGESCPSFSAIVIDGVRITDSPEWLARRLRHAGMRSINNVVDVSNFVNLELNQPNHAYDLAKVGQGFIVRNAKAGETITTLDGEVRALDGDLLICDSSDVPVGVAGIMGGLDSEVSAATTALAVEIAHFAPQRVVASASRLGLRTEASIRFERGVDPHGAERAFDRFVELLSLTCPDLSVRRGVASSMHAFLMPKMRSIEVRCPEVRRVLGIEPSGREIAELLEPIGFSVKGKGETLNVEIPSWRPDCTIEIDIIEEIARHHGYDELGKLVPKSPVYGKLSEAQRRRRRLREVVLGLGLSETMPNPFLAPGDLERVGLDSRNALRLANPLVAEESILRTSLRPGLLRTIVYNQSHRVEGVRIYELGHVYPQGDGELPDEFESLCLMAVGADAPVAMQWWNEISSALEVGAQLDQTRAPVGFHPSRSATLSRGKAVLGAVGEIDPRVLDALGVQGRVACLELNASVVCGESPKVAVAKNVSKFPSADFDLAFLVGDETTAASLSRVLRQGAGSVLESLQVFDVYRGSDLPAGSRSIGLRVTLRAGDRTLTDDEVADVRLRCIEAAVKAGGQLR